MIDSLSLPHDNNDLTSRPRPDLWDGLAVLGGTFLLWVASIFVIWGLAQSKILDPAGGSTADVIIILIIQAVVFVTGPFLIGIVFRKMTWADFGFLPAQAKHLITAAILAIIISPAASILSDWLDPDLSQILVDTFMPEEATGGRIAAMLLVAGLITPIAEEILFRGFLMGWLKNITGLWPAIILSSAIFGLIHIEPTWALVAGIIGLLLAGLYHWSGSIWTSITFHAVYNGTGLALMYGTIG